MSTRATWSTIIALALVPNATAAQPSARPPAPGVLSLLVTDDATDAPLGGVRLTLAGTTREWATDERGRFVLAVPGGGRAVLLLRRLGYEPGAINVSLTPGDTERVVYYMSRATPVLDTTKVVASNASTAAALQGFEHRLANHATGTFITREKIEKRNALQSTDLLRGLLGVQVIDTGGVRLIASTRGPKLDGRRRAFTPCLLRVVVDGLVKETTYPIDLLVPSEIHGIEVYPGPSSIPAEFAGVRQDAACGLIVVWTRVDK